MPRHSRTVLLALNGPPPTECRLFARGVNETHKGTFTFDAEAARLTMNAFEAAGVDLAIDLEHQSLDADARSRPDAADARGWCKLETRNGELWAVDIKFTPDGLARLANKTQRYFSPCFRTDDTGRVLEIVNIGLVAQPATHGATALVAASKRSKVLGARVPSDISARIGALAKQKGTTPGAILRSYAVALASTPESDGALVAELASVLGLDPAASPGDVKAAIDELFARIGSEPEGDPLADSAAPPLAPAELAALSNIKDPTQRASFIALRKQRAAERARMTRRSK
jgi:phage I-like protein